MDERMNAPFTESDMSVLLWLGDQIPGGFFIYRADESQEILYANRSTHRVFGCDSAEEFRALTGNTFRGMVHPEDFETIQASIDRQIADVHNENLDYVEYRIIRKDGAVRWVDDYGHFAQMPGYGEVYYVFIWDVTERRRAQEEKLRVELELEREKRATEVKAAFLFNLSHDIRTPMNAIMGFSDLARKHMDDPGRLGDYLEKVDTSSRQMLALLDDMLEMNQLDYGPTELKEESVDLAEQLGMSVDLFRLQAREKKLELVEEIDLPNQRVWMDQRRFRRVMENLLSNAVKFTLPGGRVTLSARQKQVSKSGYVRYELTVADTGVGISEGFLSRMYEPFEREESSTRTGEAGTGLGLSIVKGILNAMGGTITCESKKGQGTAFTVELPLKLAGEELRELPRTDTRAEGEKRILLVEDIELNRMLAETVLEEAGFLVEAVPDGCDAVEAVKNSPVGYFDAVLMDIQMPVMNGYEATKAIRAMGRRDTGEVPIIALSANAREEDMRRSMESGMNDHVAKPFDATRLIRILHESIAHRRGRETSS